MAINKYYDSDCNLGVLDGKTVAVIGFGSQGHAHSENLAESGVNVVVGLRKGSAHWEKASEFAATHENFKVMEVEEAAKAGDVVMMLVPDELCADFTARAAANGQPDYDFDKAVTAFCNRKYASDFSQEMTRSAEIYWKEFE